MVILFLLCVAVIAGVGSWFFQSMAGRAYKRYQHAFKKEASERLSEFFLFLDPAQLWVANLALCAAAMALVYVLTGLGVLAALSGAMALFAPQYGLKKLRQKRLQRFDEQLPDLLQALSGALRAGAGIQAALRQIVLQSPAPLAQEFGLLLREQRMGVSFDQALANLYRRMPAEGTSLVVSSLSIAAQTGGSLAETLEKIAVTLRARLHLLGRVQTLTSQGRLQAWIMACLPLALAVVLHRLDPDSMKALWETPAGWSVLAIIIAMEAAGIMLIRRIVNIQV